MKKSVIFSSDLDLRKLIELHKNGCDVLCPICGEPLTFILSIKDSQREQLPHGVFCKKTLEHFTLTLNVQ